MVMPDTDLKYVSDELESVVNILGAQLLSGSVGLKQLIDKIRTYRPQLIIISSHGSMEGILLSDGYINADLLKPILSTTPVELVYLNTCDSYAIADQIFNELPTAFACSLREVEDRLAYVTMATFAHHLSAGKSYVDAWLLSRKGGSGNFAFWPSASTVTGSTPMPKITNENSGTTRNGMGQIDNLHEEVSRLSYLIFGNEEWQIPGLLPTTAKLQARCNQVTLLLILLIILVALLGAAAIGWRFAV